MNKKNKILVGCLSLLLVLSVGYALFSQTVTINGTATAKGDFDLTISEVDSSLDWVDGMLPTNEPAYGIYENPKMVVTDNNVSTNVTLGSPGSSYIFTIKIENTGSIPAKLKSIKNVTDNSIIIDENGYVGNDYYCVGEKNVNRLCSDLYTDDGYTDDYEGSAENFERFSSPYVDDGMLEAVLDPGESVYYFIHYRWGDNSTTPGDPLTLDWTLQFNYEQVSAE